jgi:uridine kinase
MDETTLTELVRAIRSLSAPAGMKTRIVAVDGPGGAGKSSLAEYLAHVLDASIVHTDDFASWSNPVDWWPELLEKVLVPLAAGRSVRYTPTSWDGSEKNEMVIEPANFAVLEGVTASRAAFRPYLTYSIWIETPRHLRLRRGLHRDGEEARADWDRWMAQEDAYMDQEQPAKHADVVLPGDRDLWIKRR